MTKNFILGKLTPFANKQTVVTRSQGVNDIINGILETHDQYKNEYDKISHYFYTGSEKGTAQKIWNYLKDNVSYNIESDKFQTLRSPAAILSMGSGADCKSYALFSNGVLDSLERKGLIKGGLVYRFAGYGNNRDLEHVFSVIKTDKGEIWIDPVLGTFNQKKEPSYFKDKKINNMSLIAMAGIGDLSTDMASTDLSAPIDQGTIMPDASAATIDNGPVSSDGTPVINSDPTTGAYQEQDGTWYTVDGVALSNYDIKTGAYQEESGTWYAVDGTELSFYDPTTGNYQEVGSNVLYDANGNPIGTATQTTSAIPTKTSSVLTSGGGSGGGSGSGGGGSSASSGTTSALNQALGLLNKLFPTNTKPLTAPKPIVRTATTTTTSSNTGTYLLLGLGVAAILLLTKKSK
jgi:hypothetical protein